MYFIKDIVRGKKIYKNGQIAGFVINNKGKEVWRIVQKGGEDKNNKIIKAFNNWWNSKSNIKQLGGKRKKLIKKNKKISLKTAVKLLKKYYATKFN